MYDAIKLNRIGGVMVSMHPSSVIFRGFMHPSSVIFRGFMHPSSVIFRGFIHPSSVIFVVSYTPRVWCSVGSCTPRVRYSVGSCTPRVCYSVGSCTPRMWYSVGSCTPRVWYSVGSCTPRVWYSVGSRHGRVKPNTIFFFFLFFFSHEEDLNHKYQKTSDVADKNKNRKSRCATTMWRLYLHEYMHPSNINELYSNNSHLILFYLHFHHANYLVCSCLVHFCCWKEYHFLGKINIFHY
jgi:hypothetical protein